MKKFIVFLLLSVLSVGAFAQRSMGIRFYDRDGREFVVYAPNGQFSYSMFEGDYLSRDINGRLSRVGDTYISYDINGNVSRIGDVYISYDIEGRVIRVGGLSISYDINGNIIHTSGRVH